MSRLLYSLLAYLATPLALVWFAWRGRADRRYRRGWGERLGRAHFPRADYWLHAASVGEVQAAVPVLRALRASAPEARILVTTITPTGAGRLREAMGEAVMHCYLPLDLPGAVRRFLAAVQPRAGIIMEVEIWPNLLHAAREQGLPLLLANARLSERSRIRYQRLGRLIRDGLGTFTAVAAQTEADAERFRALSPGSAVLTVGNVKFDMPAADNLEPLRQQFTDLVDGGQRAVWVAGSTREGEEALLLDVHARLLEMLPTAVLILVPRHPERFDTVERLCRERGLPARRRSDGHPLAATEAVLLGDTMGELGAYYATGQVAFVGGTLVPVGGHNVLEPAALGRPVIVGPHTANVAAAASLLAEAGGLVRLDGDPAAMADLLRQWLTDPVQCVEAGRRAAAVVQANRGAVERVLALLPEPTRARAADG